MWEGLTAEVAVDFCERRWILLIVVRARDCILDIFLCSTKFVEHDASHRLILLILKIQSDVEGCGGGLWSCDPVLLVSSVRNLALVGLTAGLDCEERFADWGANEVALKLANLVGDHFNFGVPLSPDILIALLDCIRLILRHTLLDFGRLRELGRGDNESGIPFCVPLVSW